MSANQRGDESRGTTAECLFALEPQQIKIGREIGKGAFSVVFAGELGKKRVAVKCQPKDADGQIPPYVLKEVQILQKLQHPQLLEFIGACDHRKAKQVWILSEHSNNGDIDLLLKAIRRGTVLHVGWRRMALIALDAAQGIAFLHSQQVIHRDIKSSNILLDDQYRAKLCDFGFAMDMKTTKQHDEEDETLGKARRKSYCGTDAYMAPEMFLDEDYNESVDVFSFGVVLMELLCCRVANQDGFLMRLPQHKFRVCTPEFHAALPESCPPAFARLAEQCVSFEPSERPSADAIVSALKDLLSQKQLIDNADKSGVNAAATVELRPFTPMVKADVNECEPQEEDDDDYSDDDDDDDDEDDDSQGDDCGRGRDDTVDLESDEADSHSGLFISPEDVSFPCNSSSSAEDQAQIDLLLNGELEEDLEFRPDEQLEQPTPRPPYHAGVILKRNRRGTRAWASKWFILDGDQLHSSDDVPSPAASTSTPLGDNKNRSNSTCSTASSSGSASTLSTLALRDCRIWKTMEMPELCFNIINGNWKIKRELQAQSRDELEKWMALINQAIDYANSVAPTLSTDGTTVDKGCEGKLKPNKSNDRSTRSSSAQVPKPPLSGKQPETRFPESAVETTAADNKEQQESGGGGDSSSMVGPEDEVFQWLQAIGFQRYTAIFRAKGYASVDFIRETGIEKEDLNFLGIKDPAARKAITAASRVLRNED